MLQYRNIILALVLLFTEYRLASSVHFETLEPVRSFVKANEQSKAVQGLITRILGNRSHEIDVSVISTNADYEYVMVGIN